MPEKILKRKDNLSSFYNFVIFFLIIILLVLVLTGNFLILDKREISTSAILGETPGFDLNSTSLTFGAVVPGNGASRSIIVENTFKKNVRVIVTSKGDISDFLFVSENDFILAPGEKKSLVFSVYFPEGNEFKKYEGEITIVFRRF